MKSIKMNFKMSPSLLYKIINICSLVFAILSIVLAYSLYEKRKELIDNNKILANAINKASVAMDKDSGTKVAKFVRTSSLTNAKDINITIIQFNKQLNGIINQRNTLAKTLDLISTSLILPQKFTVKEFKKIASYKKANTGLMKLINSVNNRNDNYIEFFTKASKDIGYVVNQKDFINKNKNLAGYQKELNGYVLKTVKVKGEYELSNKELAQSKKKIIELQKINVDHLSKSNRFNLMVKEYDKQLEKLLKENKEVSSSTDKKIEQDESPVDQIQGSGVRTIKSPSNYYPNLYYKLKGKVLKFNKKWGFAIIDLGKINKVKAEIDDIVKTVNVPLPMNKQMFVSRGSKFIAKVTVSKTYDNYSVVNIGSPTDGTIEPGDIVFFPAPETTQEKNIPEN